MEPVTLDRVDARLRRVEARTAILEDTVQVYGPPKERPLLTLRLPRAPSMTEKQTTMLVYGLFLLGMGLYSWGKMRTETA